MRAEELPAPSLQHPLKTFRHKTLNSKNSQAPSKASSSSSISRSVSATPQLPSIEVLIPSAPRYNPNVELPKELTDQKLAAVTWPHDRRNGSVVSRYTTEHGWISFTVRTEPRIGEHGEGIPIQETEVDLANIYDYVTPAELERYEHHELELEAEREANRPKVGRPRKRSPSSIVSSEDLGQTIKVKRPLGRPRKHQNTAVPQRRTRQSRFTFAGVHILSPVKERKSSPKVSLPQPRSNMASPLAPATPIPLIDAAAEEAATSCDTYDPALNIDQLTPSNARRVVGAPQPGPSQRTPKAPYSMVQAALGDSDSEDGLPQSPSEDELGFTPKTHLRRFATVTEVAESDAEEAQPPISIYSSPSRQNGHNDQPTRRNGNDAVRSFDTYEHLKDLARDTEDDHTDLLEQFQATDTPRRMSSNSPITLAAIQPDSVSFVAPRQRLLDGYLQPQPNSRGSLPSSSSFDSAPESMTLAQAFRGQRSEPLPSRPANPQATPTRSNSVRKSMTPHFPASGRAERRTTAPESQGSEKSGNMDTPTKRPRGKRPIAIVAKSCAEDLDQISALLETRTVPIMAATKNITLGSLVTSSNEDYQQQDPQGTDGPGDLVSRPRRWISSEVPIITRRSPISSSSDEITRFRE
ncbi:MAG: hypothetical protein Q9182_001470 [Xanthomendoza sp. 2 TL-2023]